MGNLIFPSDHPHLLRLDQSIHSGELYSFPSGHSCAATLVWITAAKHFNIPIGVPISVVAITGLSRIYLAVHFPHDVVAGVMLGILILTVWSFTGKIGEDRNFVVMHGLLVCLMYFVNFMLYDQTKDKAVSGIHFGPSLCLGNILGVAFNEPWEGKGLKSFFLRLLFGVPVALAVFYASDVLYRSTRQQLIPTILCVLGCSWVLWFSPLIFAKVGLIQHIQVKPGKEK